MKRRIWAGVAGVLLLGFGLPGTPAAAVPEGPAPVVTAVDSYQGHPQIHIDWGVHIDAPVGIVQRAYSGNWSSSAPRSTVVDYAALSSTRAASYRAVACYENCSDFREDNPGMVFGAWWRPDVGDAVNEPGPPVSVQWRPEWRAFRIDVAPDDHPDAHIVFLRNGQYLSYGDGVRYYAEWPGEPSVTYSAVACYSDCGKAAFDAGFSQMTQPGPAVTFTEESPPIPTVTLLLCYPSRWKVGDVAQCQVAVEGEQYFSKRPTGSVQLSASGGGTLSSESCPLVDRLCQFSFTVSDNTERMTTITATYSGDQYHLPSTVEKTFLVLYATTTSLSCDRSRVAPGGKTACTASVIDENGAPVTMGSVRFEGPFYASPPWCAPGLDGTCRVDIGFSEYTSNSEVSILATYVGNDTYAGSQAWATVRVEQMDTRVELACAPDRFPLGDSTTCVAAVVDRANGDAVTIGYVEFPNAMELGGTDRRCALGASGRCEISLRPNATRSYAVEAYYTGTMGYRASALVSRVIVVLGRRTSTTLNCPESSAAVGDLIKCNVSVRDTAELGIPTVPTGTVSFGGDAVNPATCALDPGGTCTIELSTDYVHAGAREIRATYNGDAAHAQSVAARSVTIVRGESTITTAPVMSSLEDSPRFGLSAALRSATSGAPIRYAQVTFWADGRRLCSEYTDAQGRASCEGVTPITDSILGYEVRFAGDESYLPATQRWRYP